MIYKRGAKGIYSYRFKFGGRVVHESTKSTSKSVAKDAERARRRELEESYNGIAKRRTLPPTLEKAAAAWLEGYKMGVATNTAEIATLALKHLLPEFGSRLLCDIAPNDVRAYQQRRLREGAAGRTVNIETGTLRQILRVNNCWQVLDGKVKALRENKDVGRCLSPDEEERLLAGARTIDSACYTVVTLALNTALRKSEIRLLRWSQIDFARRLLTVGKSKTDAGAGRLIPLNFTAFEVLAQWAKRSAEAQPEHFVFPWCENRRIDATRGLPGAGARPGSTPCAMQG